MTTEKEDWQPHITTTNVNSNYPEVWYTGDISLIGVHNLIHSISKLIHEDKKVTLFINSGGGCVNTALLLYDYLNLNSKIIRVVGLTKICSAATLLLFTKCETFIYPNAYVLFHPVTFSFEDNPQAVNKRQGYYKFLIKTINNIYLTKNFKSKWHLEDIYLYSNDLVKRKIVDGIYEQL